MPTLGYKDLNSLKSLFADADAAIQQDEVLQEYLKATENYTGDEYNKRMSFVNAYIIQLLNKAGKPYFEDFKQKHPDVTHIRFISHPYEPDKYRSIYMEFHMNFTWPVNYHKTKVSDGISLMTDPAWEPDKTYHFYVTSADKTISECLLDAIQWGNEDMYAKSLYKFFDAAKQWHDNGETVENLKQLLTAYDTLRKYDMDTIKSFPKDIRPLLEGQYKSPTHTTSDGTEPDILQKALKAIEDSRIHYNAVQELLKTLEKEVDDWATDHANEAGAKGTDANKT